MLAEVQNEFWLAIEMCMYDVAPIRMAAIKSAHAMTHPNPVTWVDGVAAFKELERALVTDAVAAPGEAFCHDDELQRLRTEHIHDGCTVDEFSSRVNTALVKVIPFLDRPFKDSTAISRWVIGQLPVDLAPDGRGLRRALTDAEMADTKKVLAECIIIVQQANEQRNVTETIGLADETGRRPAGLGRGRGRGNYDGSNNGRGRGRGGGSGGGSGASNVTNRGSETHYSDGTLRPTSCSVQPPRGPMCDRKHKPPCWRDPCCDVALPARLKPELAKSIEADRVANGRRLNEAVKPRQKQQSGVVGIMTESDLEQCWESEDINVFDDAEEPASPGVLSTPTRVLPSCLACYTDPCICTSARDIPGTGMDGIVGAVHERCSFCFSSPCACEMLLLQAASEMGSAAPMYNIGEAVRFLNAEQMLVDGAIVKSCDANGNAVVFSGGRQCVVHKTWTFRGHAKSGGATAGSATDMLDSGCARSTSPTSTAGSRSEAWGKVRADFRADASLFEPECLVSLDLRLAAANAALQMGGKHGEAASRSVISLQGEKNRFIWKRDQALLLRIQPHDQTVDASPDTPQPVVGDEYDDTVDIDRATVRDEGGFLALTRSIVGVVLGILLLVAAAGAISFLTLAFSVSQAVGVTAATASAMRAARNITASGEFDELRQLPGIPSLR